MLTSRATARLSHMLWPPIPPAAMWHEHGGVCAAGVPAPPLPHALFAQEDEVQRGVYQVNGSKHQYTSSEPQASASLSLTLMHTKRHRHSVYLCCLNNRQELIAIRSAPVKHLGTISTRRHWGLVGWNATSLNGTELRCLLSLSVLSKYVLRKLLQPGARCSHSSANLLWQYEAAASQSWSPCLKVLE